MVIDRNTKKALVLCGGASRGALEIGFYKALKEQQINCDMIVGTSIGAFNGAMIASGMKMDAIEKLWFEFDLRQAVSWNWNWLLHPKVEPGLYSLARFSDLLHDVLPVTRFEDLNTDLTIVTTELASGRAVYWQGYGDIIRPLIASMSLPGIFSPVTLNGQPHVDGGISNNVPIDRALKLGADAAYVIECYCPDPCLRPPSGLTGILMRSFSIAVDSKYKTDSRYLCDSLDIHTVHPKFDNNVDLMDFTKSEYFIKIGYEATMEQLGDGKVRAGQANSNNASMTGHSGTSP